MIYWNLLKREEKLWTESWNRSQKQGMVYIEQKMFVLIWNWSGWKWKQNMRSYITLISSFCWWCFREGQIDSRLVNSSMSESMETNMKLKGGLYSHVKHCRVFLEMILHSNEHFGGEICSRNSQMFIPRSFWTTWTTSEYPFLINYVQVYFYHRKSIQSE